MPAEPFEMGTTVGQLAPPVRLMRSSMLVRAVSEKSFTNSNAVGAAPGGQLEIPALQEGSNRAGSTAVP